MVLAVDQLTVTVARCGIVGTTGLLGACPLSMFLLETVKRPLWPDTVQCSTSVDLSNPSISPSMKWPLCALMEERFPSPDWSTVMEVGNPRVRTMNQSCLTPTIVQLNWSFGMYPEASQADHQSKQGNESRNPQFRPSRPLTAKCLVTTFSR